MGKNIVTRLTNLFWSFLFFACIFYFLLQFGDMLPKLVMPMVRAMLGEQVYGAPLTNFETDLHANIQTATAALGHNNGQQPRTAPRTHYCICVHESTVQVCDTCITPPPPSLALPVLAYVQLQNK